MVNLKYLLLTAFSIASVAAADLIGLAQSEIDLNLRTWLNSIGQSYSRDHKIEALVTSPELLAKYLKEEKQAFDDPDWDEMLFIDFREESMF